MIIRIGKLTEKLNLKARESTAKAVELLTRPSLSATGLALD